MREEEKAKIYAVSIDIGLAVGPDGSPVFKEQKLYAYLPVDDFGLQFIVNSDFLLTGNRGDLHRVPWNQRIIDQIGIV